MRPRVQVEHLFKIFGDWPHQAMDMYGRGASKEQVLNETGNVMAVTDVSFSVGEGEIFMVMGLSGSGKSTLIRCVNRLIQPTSGRVEVDGEDVVGLSQERLRELRRSKLAMVFQHFALFPHRRVAENAEYALKVRGVPLKERRQQALQALEMVGLKGWEQRFTGDLSGGMQQRVGLARALAAGVDVLLMDEAFSALDPLIRRQMQDELINIQRSIKKTILFITHDLHEALRLGDHIAVMKDGKIVQVGTPEDIVSYPADEYVAAFTEDVDRGRVFSAGSIMQPAEALVQGRDPLGAALVRMRELERDSLYVVDGQGRPAGLLRGADAAGASPEGVEELGSVMRTDFPRATAAALLTELYGLCAPGLPVAVVDDSDRLQGVVNHVDVLSNLAADHGALRPREASAGA